MDRFAAWKWVVLALCAAVTAVAVYNGIVLAPDIGGGKCIVARPVRGATGDEGAVGSSAAGRLATDVMRNRMAELKIPGIDVVPAADGSIAIYVPNTPKGAVELAEERLRQQGHLQYRLLHRDNESIIAALWSSNHAPAGYSIARVADKKGNVTNYYVREQGSSGASDAVDFPGLSLPDKCEFMMLKQDVSGQEVFRPCIIQTAAELWELHIADAGVVGVDTEFGVTLRFSNDGARRLRNITKEYAAKNPTEGSGRVFGIVFDGKLLALSPIIKPVYNGKGFIAGITSAREAEKIAGILRSGPLPYDFDVTGGLRAGPRMGSAPAIRFLMAFAAAIVCAALVLIAGYRMQGLTGAAAVLIQLLLLPAGTIVANGFLGVFTGGSGALGQLLLPPVGISCLMGFALAVWLTVEFMMQVYDRLSDEIGFGKPLKVAADAAFAKSIAFTAEPFAAVMLFAVALAIGGVGFARDLGVGFAGGVLAGMPVALIVLKPLILNKLSSSGIKPSAGILRNISAKFGGLRMAGVIISGVCAVGGVALLIMRAPSTDSALAVSQVANMVRSFVAALVLLAVYSIIRSGVRSIACILAMVLHDMVIGLGVCSIVGGIFGVAEMAALAVVAVYSLWSGYGALGVFRETLRDPEAKRSGDFRGNLDRRIARGMGRTLLSWVVVAVFPVLVIASGGVAPWALLLLGGLTADIWARIFIAPAILFFRRKTGMES